MALMNSRLVSSVRSVIVWFIPLALSACGSRGHLARFAPMPIPPQSVPSGVHSLSVARAGDEIVIAGNLFHTGAPVVLWIDPGGYDAYRTEKRFGPFDQAQWTPGKDGKPASPDSPARYSMRFAGSAATSFTPAQLDQIRGGGWDLDLLRDKVDQFVIHYDVCGTSRQCFKVLQDMRGLSVHFMLDVDGTIYQTLDVKERAWHATTSNDRSVGIEIANIGAYPPNNQGVLNRWYTIDPHSGEARITLPAALGDGGIRTPGPFHAIRNEVVLDELQGAQYAMFDLTPQQYDSLARLTATLCQVLPKITCDYPRDAAGNLETKKLDDARLADYHGILGHFHIQQNKVDPGPAFQWDKLVGEARMLMREP